MPLGMVEGSRIARTRDHCVSNGGGVSHSENGGYKYMFGKEHSMPQHTPIGLYIHIPFCRSKCPYCDFCSFPRPDDAVVEAYVRELARRIRTAGAGLDRPVDTVYLGGGTPTLLPPDLVCILTAAVRESFSILPDAEITVEGNPVVTTRAGLSAWRAGGANRLSLGAQSAQEEELRALGRLHRWADVERTVADARAEGINNINLDFMLGIPHQTAESLADTLSRALALSPDHLSAYTLMLEEGTPFARRGRAALGLPADEEEADDRAVALWEQASATLRAAGYEHYEISNYARPGMHSRHNLHTWRCHDYLGLGVAAHSCMDGFRFGQSRDLSAFLRGEDIEEFREPLTPADREAECILLALRLADGIDERDFYARFGHGFWAIYGARCAPFLAAGLMTRTGGRIALSERGMMVSNAILTEILA